MDDYDVPHLISESLVVFVAATSGQGKRRNASLLLRYLPVLLSQRNTVDPTASLPFGLLGHTGWSVDGWPLACCHLPFAGEAPPNMQKFWRFLLRKNLPVSRRRRDPA